MIVRLNGEQHELPDGSTVAQVVERIGAAPSGVAVAMDGEVVPRASWAGKAVHEGAAIEVLTAVQGG